MKNRTCVVCGGKHYARGMCHKHYQQLPDIRTKRKTHHRLPEVNKKHREFCKKYYHEHLEPLRVYGKKYYQKHREERLDYAKKHNQLPGVRTRTQKYMKGYLKQPGMKAKRREHNRQPEVRIRINKWARKSNRKRRAMLNNIVHNFTDEQFRNKAEATNGICPGHNRSPHYVGMEKLTLDHILPVSKAPKGFVYDIGDVNPLCKSCNSSKRDN